MRYVKRFAVTALMMLCFACCFSACGGHYVSEKEMAKVEKQYEIAQKGNHRRCFRLL